jgi:hypothetical protein
MIVFYHLPTSSSREKSTRNRSAFSVQRSASKAVPNPIFDAELRTPNPNGFSGAAGRFSLPVLSALRYLSWRKMPFSFGAVPMCTPRIVLASALCLALVTATQGQTPAPSNPYYPLKPGTTWTYRVEKGEFITRVAGVDKDGLVRVEHVVNGKVVGIEQLGIDRDALARFTYDGKEIRPPVPVLKSSPRAGDSWIVDSRLSDGTTVKGKLTVSEQEITVPANKYKTLAVSGPEMEINGVKVSMTAFYAKDVGLVKQVTEMAGKTITRELVKFEAGKGGDRLDKTTEKKK